MFQDTDKLINKFYKDADTFIEKMKAKKPPIHIPIKVVESEYFLGSTDGTTYTVVPRP